MRLLILHFDGDAPAREIPMGDLRIDYFDKRTRRRLRRFAVPAADRAKGVLAYLRLGGARTVKTKWIPNATAEEAFVPKITRKNEADTWYAVKREGE